VKREEIYYGGYRFTTGHNRHHRWIVLRLDGDARRTYHHPIVLQTGGNGDYHYLEPTVMRQHLGCDIL
jgi:hypothetical protein